MENKIKIFNAVTFIIILLFIFLYLENNLIVTESLDISSDKLPKNFDGFKIVQISDLHGKVFGKDNSVLISKIIKAEPDMLVITGDLIDSSFYNENNIGSFIKRISHLAPIYFVTGNHDITSQNLNNLINLLKKYGVKPLRNSAERFERKGQYIKIIGIDDPIYTNVDKNSLNKNTLDGELKVALEVDTEPVFTVLLSHRPEQFALYEDFNIDLIFAGHAHGGQLRIPIIGNVFAPNQGFFPKYTSGKYTKGNSTMIVSRGLGNGSFPQRLFNQPEIVVTTLRK